MEAQITMRVIERFGDAYWGPAGVNKVEDFSSKIDRREWKGAIIKFLNGYAFERAGASPHYAPNAAQAVEEYDDDFDGSRFEEFVWTQFKSLLNLKDDKGTNPRNNPLAISYGSEKSIATFLSETIGGAEPNINSWAIELMKSGRADEAHKKLTQIRGIGPKIASFFLRDIAVAFELYEHDVRFSKSLQPIDRWTRWGAEAFASEMGMPNPKSTAKCQHVIIETSRQSGTDPLLINTGLWFLGSNFAESNIDFQEALKDLDGLQKLLNEAKSKLHEEAETLKERSELLDEVSGSIMADAVL